MHDRVAEVLAQRASLDRGAFGGLAVSLLLHGSITALAVYTATYQPRAAAVPTLNIRFAPVRPVTPAAPVEALKPAAPRIEAPRPEPPKPVEDKKPAERNTVPLSPFGRSSKKGSENPPPPKASAPQTTTASGTGVPDVAVGQTGVTGLEGGEFPYTIYIDRMKTLISTRWYRPDPGAEARTVVYFVVERDGRIRDAKYETTSGNSAFDRAALRAVLESSPLPPLPFGYSGTYLGVHLTFR